MPVLDGFAAAAHIRAFEAARHSTRVPIIAVTANDSELDREKCQRCGMDDVVPKPIRLAELRAAVDRWLPQRPEAPGRSNSLTN
jgi:CheY-like chemotaxis protein